MFKAKSEPHYDGVGIRRQLYAGDVRYGGHAVLLDLGWYHETLKPLLGQWALLWLRRHLVGGAAELPACEDFIAR